jgi:pyruvate,water dikinase
MLIRPIDALLPRASSSFGGKARNLAALVRGGFPVPAAYALSAEAAAGVLERELPAELQPAHLLQQRPIPMADLAEARERILRVPLGDELEGALRRAFAALSRAAPAGVAVRSSSLTEDLLAASAAGLHDSRICVGDEEELFDAVRSCWASVLSPRVASYLEAIGLEGAVGMGVVLQAVVPADAAGVLFTANPLTGDGAEMVINACYGLGSGVTDGELTPDTYRIDKASGWVRDRVIGDKRWRLDPAPDRGVVRSAVPDWEARKQALDDHQLEQLVALGRRIEDHFGDPRDVEFAVVGDAVYVLQARPVTLSHAAEPAARQRGRRRKKPGVDPSEVVWSNLNVGEALPGAASPLTWSVLSTFSELGFRTAFAALGCKVPRDVNLVGNFRGRIYLNLTELTAIASQVPGLRPSSVLPLGGGLEAERLELDAARSGSAAFVLRLPATVARFAQTNLGFQRRVEVFERRFSAERARIESMDLRILPGAALDETLTDVHQLLDETGSMLLTSYGALLSALLPLRTALRLFKGEAASRVQHALLSDLEDVESANPGREVLRLARIFERDAGAREVLLRDRPTHPSQLPAGEARRAVERFLQQYGHRAVREAELMEPRWRERPRLLFDALRVHLQHTGDQAEAVLERRVAAVREAADNAMASLPAAVRPTLKGLLSIVRHYLRLRERLRSHVVHVLGLFRLVALDASRRLEVREPDIGPDAAFFLTLAELHGVLRGEHGSVGALVRLRRAQFERDRSLPDPPDTFVGFPPPLVPADRGDGTLRGQGASSGAVEARVRVLRTPDDVEQLAPGEVLVVPSADVGWAPVFVVAGGLVTERGGPLSHACVVAREYGLPAVVGVRGATGVLRTGDRVRVDGDQGTVRVLRTEPASETGSATATGSVTGSVTDSEAESETGPGSASESGRAVDRDDPHG